MPPGSDPPPRKRSYSRDEVQAILSRALETAHGHGDDLSHEELLAIGRELGIAEEAIVSAAANIGTDIEVARSVAERIRSTRRGFVSHLIPYVIVNGMLAALNLLNGGPLWFLWPLFGWGIGLALHARAAIFPDRPALAAKAKKRIERERAKEREREERRARKQGGRGGDRIEAAVQDVVAGTLGAIADAIEDSRRRSRTPDPTRVAAPPKGEKPPVRVNAGGVRIAEPEIEAEDEMREEARRRSR